MPPGEKNEGPSFLLDLGSRLGKMESNIEFLFGRLDALEGMGQQQPTFDQNGQQLHQAQPNQQPSAAPAKASTPLDTFAHFTGETSKLMAGIASLQQMAKDFAPMIEAFKASKVALAPATTQTAQPVAAPATAQPATPAAPASVFQPVPGHA